MGSQKYLSNEATGLVDEILRRNAALEQKVDNLERALKNQDTPGFLPRIDPTTYPSPYEGQRAIDITDEQHTWYSDGLWRKAGGGNFIYAIEVFENFVPLVAGDGAFEWEIPEDVDGAILIKAEAYITTVSSSGTVQVQIRNETQAVDMLTTKLTIDVGELNSKDSSTPHVVDTANDDVVWGDHLNIDVDAIGTGTTGLGVILFFAPAQTANVALTGLQGPPGGITSWLGQWVTSTAYTAGQAVSNNGSSYVAITNHTSGASTEPGVGASWQTAWMLLAGNQQFTTVAISIMNGSYPLDTGVSAIFDVPFAATILSSRVIADRIGSCVLDIKKSTYAGYAGSLASIVSSSPPTLSSVIKSEDTALSGWTTSIAAGDILQVSVTSVSVLRLVTLALKLQRI